MRPRTAAVVAATAALVASALLVAAWALAYQNGDLNVLTSAFGPDLVVNLGILLVGLIIATRRRDNPIGWLFLGSSVLGALHAASGEYALRALHASSGLAGGQWAAWLSNWIIDLVFPAGGFLLTLLLFPTGRLLSPRWRILAWAALLFTALMVFITVPNDYPITIAPNVPPVANPIGIRGSSSTIGNLWVVWPVGVLLLCIACASVVVRYRRSFGDERQQLKWFAFATAATLAGVAVSIPLASAATSTPFQNAVLELGVGVAMPAACAIAILKYKLYGIDNVISRTLVYGSLAVFITAVYVGIAVGLGALIGGGGKPNLGLSILATAIVAVGFQPARERLQKLANRLVYGKRATPYEVLSQFSARVAESYATDDVMPRMARVLAEGTGAQRADVWLRSGTLWREAAVWPADAIPAQSIVAIEGTLPAVNGQNRLVEVRHQGDLLGALGVTKRGGESLTPVEENLLAHLAGQAGLVLKNVGLTGDLQARLEELRASRQRLVAAQDEERRRLERNLHDGAQQHLVAIKVKLGLAEMLVGRDPERARTTLHQLKCDADEALETLRDLARGIYPPLLAEKGLKVALESQATKASIAVTIDAVGVGRYSQDMEAAIYFCCLEALQNVQKYAQASRVVIRVREADGTVTFEVQDDGHGFDVASVKKGAGLTNMADRLDALGGTLHVTSSIGQGTVIAGSLDGAVASALAAAG